jgi:ABC-type multidrug transport system fused ATPase/permease subunit
VRGNHLLFDFIKKLIEIDSKFISEKEIAITCDDFARLLIKFSQKNVYVLAIVLPSLTCFVAFLGLVVFLDRKLLLFLITAQFIFHVILLLLQMIKEYCVSIQEHNFSNICILAAKSAKGSLFFKVQDTTLKNFKCILNSVSTITLAKLSKQTWLSFFCTCGLFCVTCFVFLFVEQEYLSKTYHNLAENIIPVTGCFVSYCIFFIFLKLSKKFWKVTEEIATLMNALPELQHSDGIIRKPKKDIFIAFHGVCFQQNNIQLLSNVTFSVLPKNNVVITGEKVASSSHIFDLLLKFNRPQSGNIYVTGNNINSLNTEALRSKFAIFAPTFGLVAGTIEDNIKIATSENSQELEQIIHQAGLIDILLEPVYNKYGEIAVSQETLIDIQMARIFLQNPQIILIEDQNAFDNEISMHKFHDFVSFLIKNKTTILATTNSDFVVYASRILYLGETTNLFGTHAELSFSEEYGNFFANLSKFSKN